MILPTLRCMGFNLMMTNGKDFSKWSIFYKKHKLVFFLAVIMWYFDDSTQNVTAANRLDSTRSFNWHTHSSVAASYLSPSWSHWWACTVCTAPGHSQRSYFCCLSKSKTQPCALGITLDIWDWSRISTHAMFAGYLKRSQPVVQPGDWFTMTNFKDCLKNTGGW